VNYININSVSWINCDEARAKNCVFILVKKNIVCAKIVEAPGYFSLKITKLVLSPELDKM
jgi:hypothetical protein